MEDASRVLLVSRAVRRELQSTDGSQSSPAQAEAIGRLVAKLSLDNLMYESSSEVEEFEEDVVGDDDHGIVVEEFREQLEIRPEALSTRNARSGGVGRKDKGNNRKRKHQAHATTTTTTTSISTNSSPGFTTSSATATTAIPAKRSKTSVAVISNAAAGSKKRSLEDANDIVSSGSTNTMAMNDDATVTRTRRRSDSLVAEMDAKMAAAGSQGDNLGTTSRAESLSSNNGVASGAASASATSIIRPRKRLQRAAKSSSAAAAAASNAGGAAIVDGENSG